MCIHSPNTILRLFVIKFKVILINSHGLFDLFSRRDIDFFEAFEQLHGMISVCSRINLNDRLSVEAADILDFQRHFYATVFIFGMYIGILKLGVGKTEAKRERSLFALLVEQCIAVVVAVVDNLVFSPGNRNFG